VSTRIALAAAFLVAGAVLAWPSRRRLASATRLVPAPGDSAVSDRPWRPALRPDLVLELVACGLRAGLSVEAALGAAAEASREPYLQEVLGRLRLGVRIQRAWARPPPAYAGLAKALVLAELSGAPAAAVVSRAAADDRAARRERVELAAARLGVRLVLPLGLAVLPGFVLLAVVPIVLGLATSVLRASA
jgi:pilus assembly protein TadC